MSYSKKDLSRDDIFQILNLAKDYKNLNLKNEKKSLLLKGVTVVNSFF